MDGLWESEAGQALIAGVGAVLALAARAGVRWLDAKIKRTPTKIDDKIRKAVRDELRRDREGR